jgi:hypothetical protein
MTTVIHFNNAKIDSLEDALEYYNSDVMNCSEGVWEYSKVVQSLLVILSAEQDVFISKLNSSYSVKDFNKFKTLKSLDISQLSALDSVVSEYISVMSDDCDSLENLSSSVSRARNNMKNESWVEHRKDREKDRLVNSSIKKLTNSESRVHKACTTCFNKNVIFKNDTELFDCVSSEAIYYSCNNKTRQRKQRNVSKSTIIKHFETYIKTKIEILLNASNLYNREKISDICDDEQFKTLTKSEIAYIVKNMNIAEKKTRENKKICGSALWYIETLLKLQEQST